MRCATSSTIALTLWLMCSSASHAHHSTRAFYDRDTTVEIEGTVTSVAWRNPHVGLTISVRNDQGVEEAWTLEGGAMNTLMRRGFTADSVAIGEHVRVAGAPSNRGENALYVTNMLLPNGTEVRFGDRVQAPRWTAVENGSDAAGVGMVGGLAVGREPVRDIFRVWTAGTAYRLRTPLALTAAARAAREAWDPTTDDPALRCEAPGMPNAILNPYPIEFVDAGDEIRIRIEEWDAVRTIHLAGGAIPDQAAPGRLGVSTGHWEGDTLVVRTTKVDWPLLDDSGTPLGEGADMIERFDLDRARGRLSYTVAVTDPQNLLEPAVWEGLWIWVPGVEVRPFHCAAH